MSAGHGALTAVRAGQGSDLVILHSLLADRTAFDPVLPALTAKFRVTLINLPGFHGSQPLPLALMDGYIAAIEDGFEEFGIGNDSVLIGNGFGGTVALAFALAHPERISKLVLSDAAACFPPQGREAFAVMAQKVAEAGWARSPRSPPSACIRRPICRRIRRRSSSASRCCWGSIPKRSRRACKILQEADLTPLLHHLRVPTLVVCGELDQATPPALNKRSWRKWRARNMSNCPAAAIARRSSSRSSSWPRSRISWGSRARVPDAVQREVTVSTRR